MNIPKIIKDRLNQIFGDKSSIISVGHPVGDVLSDLCDTVTDTAEYAESIGNLVEDLSDDIATIISYDINEQITDYTITDQDLNKLVVLRSDDPVAVTIPDDLTLDNGSRIDFVQAGVGVVTFVPALGMSLVSKDGNTTTSARYVAVSLVRLTETEWLLIGDLA
jgi:hypothetical protein